MAFVPGDKTEPRRPFCFAADSEPKRVPVVKRNRLGEKTTSLLTKNSTPFLYTYLKIASRNSREKSGK